MMDLRRILASRVSDPLFWKVVKRYPVLDRLSEWRQHQWDGAAALEARQMRALGALLSHALARVPYYAEKVPGLTPEGAASAPGDSLAVFPPLEKRDVILRADSLTCEMDRGSYWNLTGGSTGEPMRFRQDRVYLTNALATAMLFYEWAGFSKGASHIKLWGAPRDLGSGSVARRRRVADWLFNRITLDAFDMSERTMRRYAETIASSRPACLEGYVDGLYELAVRVERHGLRMNAPGAIVSSAGTLLPHMRERIESAFGAEVFDRYGTREVGRGGRGDPGYESPQLHDAVDPVSHRRQSSARRGPVQLRSSVSAPGPRGRTVRVVRPQKGRRGGPSRVLHLRHRLGIQ